MAYTKTTWTDEVPGETPVKYVITGANSDCTIELKTAPTAGTPVNATNLNHIEEGIYALGVFGRQGGDPNEWNVPGVTNYTPSIVRMEFGVISLTITANNYDQHTLLTFGTSFGSVPMLIPGISTMFSVVSGEVVNCWASATTAGSTDIWISRNMNPAYPLTVHVAWLAIGPG